MGDLAPDGKPYSTQERASFDEALSLLSLRVIQCPDKQFSLAMVAEWHAKVADGIPRMLPGEFRTSQNTSFGRFRSCPPQEVVDRMRQLSIRIQKVTHSVDIYIDEHEMDEKCLMYVVDQSAYLHAEFIAIHPFMDGNGRIGRLLQVWMLAKYDIVPPNFENKEEYLMALNEYHDGKGHGALSELSLKLISLSSEL